MDGGDRAAGSQGMVRMRWRLRGAWLWPTFVVATVLEMGLLHWLPVQGDGAGWVGALLAAGCLNVIAVALVAGIGGSLLRRRRPDLPKVVADDYAGTTALALVAVAFVVAGVLHRPVIAGRRAAFAEQSQAVRDWVAIHGDAFARAHVDHANTITVDDGLFRTCVPKPDPRSALCLVVDTSRSPPAVKVDSSSEPNARFSPRGGFR